MDYSTIFASLSVLIASITLLMSIRSKKYEYSYQLYKDVLDWYIKVMDVFSVLRQAELDKTQKKSCLAKLSSLIEIGRFYFPNIDKGDGYGQNKPIAYRGYRHVALDFLVYAYQLFSKDDSNNYDTHTEVLQRLFTSEVYKYLEPSKHRVRTSSVTDFSVKNDITIKEFLETSPNSIYLKYYFK